MLVSRKEKSSRFPLFGGRFGRRGGFTLIEVCIVVLLAGMVIYFASAAIATSRRDALEMRATAAVLQLNHAATRARIKGEVGPGTYGSDPVQAVDWYVSNGYIREEVDLFGVAYVDGQWDIALPW